MDPSFRGSDSDYHLLAVYDRTSYLACVSISSTIKWRELGREAVARSRRTLYVVERCKSQWKATVKLFVGAVNSSQTVLPQNSRVL